MLDNDTTQLGVSDDDTSGALTEDAAAAAFLKRWEDAVTPSDSEEEEHDEDQSETDGSRGGTDESEDKPESDDDGSEKDPDDDSSDADETEETEGEDEETDKVSSKIASDDMEVTVTVDGQEHKVSVKDLKRLYGQEASLTRKSQEVAAAKKRAEEQAVRHVAALEKLVQKAQDRWQQFAEIDMLVAQQRLNPDEFAQLRKDAKIAFDDLRFLTEELDSVMSGLQEQRQSAIKEQAQKTLQLLKDPESKFYIPDWSNALYDEIRTFAIEQGLPADEVNNAVDPAAIKILHMALQYHKNKKVATEKKAKVTPKKVIVNKKGASPSPKAGRAADAMHRLKESGSVEDAAAAFMALWS